MELGSRLMGADPDERAGEGVMVTDGDTGIGDAVAPVARRYRSPATRGAVPCAWTT